MAEGNLENQIEEAYNSIVSSDPVYTFEGEGPKRLLVMSGLPLSGKTFFVNKMLRLKPGKFQQINSHSIRPIMVKHLGRQRPIYDKTESVATFEVAQRLILKVLTNKWPVIADATNLTEKYRAWAIDAGRKAEAEILVVFLQVTDQTAQTRLNERTSKSSATYETYEKLKYDMEPVNKCSVPYLVVDSEVDISPHVSNVAKWLCGEINTIPGTITPKQS